MGGGRPPSGGLAAGSAQSRATVLFYLHLIDPHAPYEPQGTYDKMFVGDEHYDPAVKVEVRGKTERGTPSVGFRASHGSKIVTIWPSTSHSTMLRFERSTLASAAF